MANYEEIEKLHELRKNGIITEEEYEAEKYKMLNDENKSKNSKKFKIILLLSVIGFVSSIILGNVFNAIRLEIGRYIAMGILYVTVAMGIIGLIGYIIASKKENKKIATWVIVIIGIIIALIVANVIASIVDYEQQERINYYTQQEIGNNDVNKGNDILKTVRQCTKDCLENKMLMFFSKYGVGKDEEIIEIRYTNDDNEIITLIKTTSQIYEYKGTTFLTSDILADLSYAKNEEEREWREMSKQVRRLWQNAKSIELKQILNNIE